MPTDYKVLFERLPVPAYIYADADFRLVAVNAAALARYGYTRQQFLARTLHDLRDPSFKGDGERHVTKGGAAFDVDLVTQPIVYGGRRAFYAVVSDLTERREAEQRLQDLNTRLRNLSSRARARREEDRTRLSRELHDQLGQSLASLKIELCLLSDHLASQPSRLDEVAAKIRALTALVDETIDGVRRMASQLRPPVLDRLGLIAAIEWQIDDFQRRSGIHVRLQSRLEQVPLDLGRSTAVFRIFQEALTNVVTHSKATQVTVRMSTASDTLLLVITDNGRGIPQDVIDRGESLGLVGMRERAELLGGGLVVRPGRPHGTIVTVTVPLHDRRKSARESW